MPISNRSDWTCAAKASGKLRQTQIAASTSHTIIDFQISITQDYTSVRTSYSVALESVPEKGTLKT